MTARLIKEIKQSAPGTLDMYIYGDVCDTDPWTGEQMQNSQDYFRQQIEAHPGIEQINLYVNSNGGDVLEAMGIRAQLKRHPAKVTAYVDGWAASAASLIITAADEVVMDSAAMQMLHNMWVIAAGNANELRKLADDLDKLMEGNRQAYLDKAGDKLSEERLIDLMNEESWLTAEECMDIGLCNRIGNVAAALPPEQSATQLSADGVYTGTITERLSPESPPDNEIETPEEPGTNEASEKGAFFMAALRKAAERMSENL